VIDEINRVRDSIGVSTLVFSKDIFLISEKNAINNKNNSRLSHSNDIVTAPSGEICNFVPVRVTKDSDSLKNIAKSIVNGWRTSPEHWKILTDSRCKFIGGSSLITSVSGFCGKNKQYFDTYSTINFK
jgi:uncharacterized protein YkwD